MSTVLVVDDKEMMRDSIGATLRRAGFGVVCADGAAAALDAIASRRPDAVVSDMKMPGQSGIDLLERIRQFDADLPVVLMTAYGSVETAVRAIKLGAFDYITKPFEGDELIIAVKRAIGHTRLVRENALLRAGQAASHEGVAERIGLNRVIGSSPAMQQVKEQVRLVAASSGTVLISGETGTGKEVLAKGIHELSPRREGPLLGVNCAALSESLLESELFGHERGAFTGAERLRKGRFELADGGTLLLDEVSEISPHLQAKLLRVLQEQTFERVGSSVTIGLDVRIIATTNRRLEDSVDRGRFRRDLYYRLNVLPIRVPPLRDRIQDVEQLAEHFIMRIARREGLGNVSLEPEATALLREYDWPGNVRELQNICERAVVLSRCEGSEGAPIVIDGRLIEPWLNPGVASPGDDGLGIPVVVRPNGGRPGDLVRPLEEIERAAIVRALARFDGHRQKTARALGIGVRTLGLKLKKWKEQELVSPNL